MGQGSLTIVFFANMFSAFDNNLMGTIDSGSAAIISLIMPVLAAGFSLYLLLVSLSYLRGNESGELVVEFWIRMAIVATWITLGLNIQYYTTYVVPVLQGFGDSISAALTGSPTDQGTLLDNLCTGYLHAVANLWANSSGIEGTLICIAFTFITFIFVGSFAAIAAAYTLLAKFALGVLLAIGPLFFGAGIFPWTRQYFMNWLGQCLNYGFLTCLFAAAGMIEVNFGLKQVPTALTLSSLLDMVLMGVGFILVSLNLPTLASQLAGGVGISSMVGKIAGAAQAMKALSKGGGDKKDKSGGSMKGSGSGGKG